MTNTIVAITKISPTPMRMKTQKGISPDGTHKTEKRLCSSLHTKYNSAASTTLLIVIFKKEKQQKQEVETDTVNGWYCRVVGSKILLTSINKVSKIMLPHVDM